MARELGGLPTKREQILKSAEIDRIIQFHRSIDDRIGKRKIGARALRRLRD